MTIAATGIFLPLWLVVGQWVLLFALGFLILVMYRQTGYIQSLKDRGSERDGLSIGGKAPSFDFIPANQKADASTHFQPIGQWTLLLFADPGCVSCQNALLALEELMPKFKRIMRIMVVTTSEPAHIAAVEAFNTESFSITRVNMDVPSKLYRAGVTPFAYMIDPEGIIRSKGIATDKSSIQQIVRKADRSSVNVELVIS